MSAVQEAIGQHQRGLRRLIRWPWCWPLLSMPASLIVYFVTVLACVLGLIGWELADTPIQSRDLLLFGALLAAAVICIEAMRRLGQPTGVSRDLLSAWWLPVRCWWRLSLPSVSICSPANKWAKPPNWLRRRSV